MSPIQFLMQEARFKKMVCGTKNRHGPRLGPMPTQTFPMGMHVKTCGELANMLLGLTKPNTHLLTKPEDVSVMTRV